MAPTSHTKEEVLRALRSDSHTHLNVNIPSVAWDEVVNTTPGCKNNAERLVVLVEFWITHNMK